VVAHPRDRADFDRFARLTTDHTRLDADGIAELEPSLDGRFREALFFPGEGHVEPRSVLPELHAKLTAAGGTIKFGSDCERRSRSMKQASSIDCRGHCCAGHAT
jgi:glycine oxidase